MIETLKIGWPQLACLLLIFIGIGAAMAKHDEPKTGKHSVWVTLTASSLCLWLLWAGGFFTK